MISSIFATEFVRPATNGRTGPLIFGCYNGVADEVEVFAKFSEGCEQGVVHLAREMLCACLAADLGLPVNSPYFLRVPTQLLDAIVDQSIVNRIRNSSPLAFASRAAPRQFSTWGPGNRVDDELLPVAAATFVFDAIVQNPDRLPTNSNCLVRGNEIRLIDHELAFTHRQVLFWRSPWEVGSMSHLEAMDRHIFVEHLRNKRIDFGPIRDAWASLSDARLSEYEAALPPEWADAAVSVRDDIALISGARDRIDDCITEIRRILE